MPDYQICEWLLYLDPPYANTKGMYFGGIELDKFFDWIRSLNCRWLLSFDGRTDKEDLSFAVPRDIFVSHEYLRNGNSAFRRVIGHDRYAQVEESLYTNFVPHAKYDVVRQLELL